jgi:hypothetical protein
MHEGQYNTKDVHRTTRHRHTYKKHGRRFSDDVSGKISVIGRFRFYIFPMAPYRRARYDFIDNVIADRDLR